MQLKVRDQSAFQINYKYNRKTTVFNFPTHTQIKTATLNYIEYLKPKY